MEQRWPSHLPGLLLHEKRTLEKDQELLLRRHDSAADWPPATTRINNSLGLAHLVCTFSPLSLFLLSVAGSSPRRLVQPEPELQLSPSTFAAGVALLSGWAICSTTWESLGSAARASAWSRASEGVAWLDACNQSGGLAAGGGWNGSVSTTGQEHAGVEPGAGPAGDVLEQGLQQCGGTGACSRTVGGCQRRAAASGRAGVGEARWEKEVAATAAAIGRFTELVLSLRDFHDRAGSEGQVWLPRCAGGRPPRPTTVTFRLQFRSS